MDSISHDPELTESRIECKKLLAMKTALPNSTAAEHRRFLQDCNGKLKKAIEMLEKYLEWRNNNYEKIIYHSMDHEDAWQYASQLAIRNIRKVNLLSTAAEGNNNLKLPVSFLITTILPMRTNYICTLFQLLSIQS